MNVHQKNSAIANAGVSVSVSASTADVTKVVRTTMAQSTVVAKQEVDSGSMGYAGMSQPVPTAQDLPVDRRSQTL